MKIEILGAESLGVRSLCCFVQTENQKILIDPGIALGYIRYKFPPHPLQVAVDEKIQKKIMCGADFMKKPRMLLEAQRRHLYEQMPVPEGWHEDYSKGKVNTDYYWNLAKKRYNIMGFDYEK